MLALFLAEGRDLLNRVDAELMTLERTPDSRAALDAAFRAIHSLKGMSATVALDDAAEALHAGETVLAAAREAAFLDPPQLAALLALNDGIRSALDAAETGAPAPVGLPALASRLDASVPAPRERDDAQRERRRAARAVHNATSAAGAHWRVDVGIAHDAAIPSARATVVLRRLAAMLPVLAVSPDADVQADEAWDRQCTIWLGHADGVATHDAATIERAVRGAGDIERCHVTREVSAARTDAVPARTVRIPAQRLDDLLDLVGELVLSRDRLLGTAAPDANETARQALEDASRLILQLRDAILHSRMVPLAEVFDRFPRHVRDTALALGKEIDLVLEGRELEVDRSLLDELSDPLLHLLRNAVDHGLESATERLEVGKPARGKLVVRAVRDGAMVAVTVADDGRGVDRERVAASARAQGVDGAADMVRHDQGLLQLLARPGLSTATAVTTLSGRGVGVDAVLSRVHALGGRVELVTADGAGTAITIRLPLSVAMLRALLVRVAGETYAIPLALIHGTHLAEGLRGRHASRLPEEIEVAGSMVRLVSLRAHLGLPPADDVSGHLVVLDGAAGRVALLVDACLSQHEIVVKPLQRVRGSAPKFSGGTILPDGTPSLILDINTLP